MVFANPQLLKEMDTLNLHALREKHIATADRIFTDSDAFEGVATQPLSLHKYAYTHADPINFSDPSGHSEFSLASLMLVGGLRGLLAGTVIGGSIREASYFISTPMEEWSTNGALSAFGKGAATGAFGATLIGTSYFALEGIYSAYNVWTNPNSSGIQKALASVNMLVGMASAFFLKGQVQSQWTEWKNVYSKVPLATAVQTDLSAIRNAWHGGADSIKLGQTTVLFADNPRVYGGTFGRANEFYITKSAVDASDEVLMKTIIEENLHNGRIVGNRLGDNLSVNAASVGQAGAVQAEEGLVKQLTDDIYQRGKQAGWW